MGPHQLEQLLGLSELCAKADGAASLVSQALPLVREIAGADAVVVVRRDGEDLVAGQADGITLETPGTQPGAVRGVLSPVAVAEAWVSRGVQQARAQELPGHLGVLVLAWTSDVEISPGLRIAMSVLESGLARVEAATDLDDLTSRVDNAQHLAHMGDYDWHIPSDTNRWSDELFRIYGYEPQSFNASYERFLSLIHPDDRDRISGVHQQAYATGEPYEMLERIVRPSGDVRYLSSNGEVVMDADGAPVRMRGTCIDITDRVLAERDREHLDARYRSLVEAAPDAILVLDPSGHVLDANPCALELLRGDPTRRWMGDLGPIDVDGNGVEITRLDGTTVLADVTRAAMGTDDGKDGMVAVFLRDASSRLEGEAMAARWSQAQLRRRQALEINDNVVQGLVAAAYALDAEQYPVVATYIDRTLGSARAMMDDLLEPLDGQDLVPGDLVRANPASMHHPEERLGGPVPAPAPQAGEEHRVLVVDDADDLRQLLRDKLARTAGYTVVGEAADGVTAVELARDLQPDLVLLDLAMPRMDGLEALPLIREAVPDVHVIVFSGFNQHSLAERALEAGADRYVVKGGSLRELMTLVESVLQPS